MPLFLKMVTLNILSTIPHLWHGRGNRGGSWPPVFPRSSENFRIGYLLFRLLNLYIHCGHFWFLLNLLFSHFFWSITVLLLIANQNFKFSRLLICCSGYSKRPSDWLNYKHFSGYKIKIKLILRLIKRWDHALMSISTILKFSVQHINQYKIIYRDDDVIQRLT